MCGITMRNIPKLISDCLGSGSVVLPRPPQVHNNEVQTPNLVVVRDIILQCLHKSPGTEMRASQTAILSEHVDESFIWRCTREFAIMKIKIGLALPDMPSTYMSVLTTVAAPKRPFMQGDLDETE